MPGKPPPGTVDPHTNRDRDAPIRQTPLTVQEAIDRMNFHTIRPDSDLAMSIQVYDLGQYCLRHRALRTAITNLSIDKDLPQYVRTLMRAALDAKE